MEEDLKVLKVEYLSNSIMDHAQILIQAYCLNPQNEDDLKILKVENRDLGILRRKLEENSISSVALLSQACF